VGGEKDETFTQLDREVNVELKPSRHKGGGQADEGVEGKDVQRRDLGGKV